MMMTQSNPTKKRKNAYLHFGTSEKDLHFESENEHFLMSYHQTQLNSSPCRLLMIFTRSLWQFGEGLGGWSKVIKILKVLETSSNFCLSHNYPHVLIYILHVVACNCNNNTSHVIFSNKVAESSSSKYYYEFSNYRKC